MLFLDLIHHIHMLVRQRRVGSSRLKVLFVQLLPFHVAFIHPRACHEPSTAFRQHLAVHGEFGHLHAAALSLPRGAAAAPAPQELPSRH